jgi:hypothetical protein
MAAPFATLQKGHDVAAAGDTVWVHGGTYAITTPKTASAGINLTKSGTSDTNRIKFWAVAGELPVFDFANMVISATGYTNGFNVSGSWLHIKGFEIKNVPMNTNSNNGMSASGSNNIFEFINFHHNKGTGLFINAGMGGNLILNCDSHDNYDPNGRQGDGQNADGFGVHYQMSGNPTVIRGCRAWWNSDDGYDFINHEVSVHVEGSWAMANGYANSGALHPADGNGNGFKAGSSMTGVRHIISNCLAWGNYAAGFYANHSLGGNTWYNNTSYRNGTQYNMLATDPTDSTGTKVILMGDKVHIMRNNIGFPNSNSNMEGVDTASNSWDLMLTPADSDFAGVSAGTGTRGAAFTVDQVPPRLADGSLPPTGTFMHLSATSKFIDKGTNVMLPFAGTAPDLGCYETGLPAGGTGGAGGAGGTSAGGTSAGGTSAGGAGNGGMGVGGSGMAGASAGTDAGGMSSGGATATSGAPVGGAGAVSGASGSVGTGGTSSATGGNSVGGAGATTSTGGASGAPITGGGDSTVATEAEDSGCGCTTVGRRSGAFGALLAAFGFLVIRARRRR